MKTSESSAFDRYYDKMTDKAFHCCVESTMWICGIIVAIIILGAIVNYIFLITFVFMYPDSSCFDFGADSSLLMLLSIAFFLNLFLTIYLRFFRFNVNTVNLKQRMTWSNLDPNLKAIWVINILYLAFESTVFCIRSKYSSSFRCDEHVYLSWSMLGEFFTGLISIMALGTLTLYGMVPWCFQQISRLCCLGCYKWCHCCIKESPDYAYDWEDNHPYQNENYDKYDPQNVTIYSAQLRIPISPLPPNMLGFTEEETQEQVENEEK